MNDIKGGEEDIIRAENEEDIDVDDIRGGRKSIYVVWLRACPAHR